MKRETAARVVRRGPATPSQLWFVALVSLALSGCFTPPVLLETPRGTLNPKPFPPGTELVTVEVEPGTSLRGVFVPARGTGGAPAEGRPIVLGFLESSATLVGGARSNGVKVSASSPTIDEALMGDELEAGLPIEAARPPFQAAQRWLTRVPELGFSVLALDYTGIGASDGERSPANLRRDAHAAWDEALRRAGGDPSRVVLRGVSIGALAVAALLQDGVQPAAVVLVAPVRAETVARNGARALRGPWTSLLARLVMAPALDVDLVEQLRQCPVPTLVVMPVRDAFLRSGERRQLRDAVAESGGLVAVRYDDHIALSLAARDLLVVESWFLGQLPGGVDAGQRLRDELAVWQACAERDGGGAMLAALQPGEPAGARLQDLVAERPISQPGVLGALALADAAPDDSSELLDLLAWLPPARRAQLDPPALCWLFDLDDPAGRLTGESLFHVRGVLPSLTEQSADEVAALLADALVVPADPSADFSFALGLALGGSLDSVVANRPRLLAAIVDAREERGLLPADAHRQALRLALKAAGIPDRVRTDAAGNPLLEVREAGGWRELAVP